MSSAIVDDLLEIKVFREDRASAEVTKCRVALEEAVMLIGIVFVVAILSNAIQVGVLFAFDGIKPKLDKLNPAAGFKRIFGMKNLIENLKSVLKVLFLSGLIIWIVYDAVGAAIRAPYCGLPCIEFVMAEMMKKIAIFTSAAFIIVAAFDYAFQKAQHIKSLKMTKDQVKREYKESEGDPLIKSKRRQLAQELVMSDQGSAVRKASVVVTNPTRIAIALRYVQGETPLPMVVAKGEHLNAERIIKIAKEAGIPIMENVPLARALMEEVEVDRYIPSELLEPVAEVLRWVRTLQAQKEAEERLW
jgi:type III secretion protein U